MRSLLVLLILTTLIFSSCKKTPFEDPALVGSWKMVEIKDNANDSIITKPASIPQDVEIVFSYSKSGNGKISGNTTIASFEGNFAVGKNEIISIPAIIIKYPGFDVFWGSFQWDSEFLNNITISKDYFFDFNGHLNINTTNDKTLVFERE